ncbi:Uncharacterised protein [Mycobacteroides abscessus subsp. abscessus]|nr:Uncharacterised protein [Mycobacteroides abscessus subsp. abscessus]
MGSLWLSGRPISGEAAALGSSSTLSRGFGSSSVRPSVRRWYPAEGFREYEFWTSPG